MKQTSISVCVTWGYNLNGKFSWNCDSGEVETVKGVQTHAGQKVIRKDYTWVFSSGLS